jgi:hypothetical protein
VLQPHSALSQSREIEFSHDPVVTVALAVPPLVAEHASREGRRLSDDDQVNHEQDAVTVGHT